MNKRAQAVDEMELFLNLERQSIDPSVKKWRLNAQCRVRRAGAAVVRTAGLNDPPIRRVSP
ncbi:hypothetical protein Q3A80_11185 [Burkholderia sp. SR8]|uniref:hypothetical protein n=1 Tax=Burkholderia sp. SR8 TaxID=3062277 RepID=UPI004064AB16